MCKKERRTSHERKMALQFVRVPGPKGTPKKKIRKTVEKSRKGSKREKLKIIGTWAFIRCGSDKDGGLPGWGGKKGGGPKKERRVGAGGRVGKLSNNQSKNFKERGGKNYRIAVNWGGKEREKASVKKRRDVRPCSALPLKKRGK